MGMLFYKYQAFRYDGNGENSAAKGFPSPPELRTVNNRIIHGSQPRDKGLRFKRTYLGQQRGSSQPLLVLVDAGYGVQGCASDPRVTPN